MLLFVGINAKYIHTNIAIRYFYHLCKEIYPCKFLEFNINQDLNDVLFRIVEEKPKYIAISVYIWNALYVRRLVEGIRKVLKDVKIILGGPEVYFDELKDWQYVDFIVRGEGEPFFVEFCKAISENREFICRDYQYFDMEKLPFPYKDEKIDVNKIYYYETSRGCPFNCFYCLSSLDKKVRFAPMEKVFDDIKFFFDNRVRLLKFVDRTFNIDKARAIEIIEFCKRYSKETQVHLEIEPSLLDEDIISTLNASKEGLFRLEMGIQSFKSDTLKAIGRGFVDLERLDRNIKKLLEEKKCFLHLDLIAGLPYEGFEGFKKSLDKTIFYFADEVQLGFLKLLKGTRIRNEAEVYNYEYYTFPPYEVLSNKFISYREIYRLKRMETLLDRLYNRKNLYWTLRYIFRKFSPSEVFERLSYKVDCRKNTRDFISDLYKSLLNLRLIEDYEILKNLFRFDVLSIHPEDYLPEELVFSSEEKDIIRAFKKIQSREIFRSQKIGIFYFDIERLVKEDILEKGRYIYRFLEGKIEKFLF
ncbi:MAG: DUF4080 domain-containing protein [bacterium]